MPMFSTNQVVTAAQLNALNGYVLKTADQSVTSSTVLVNDNHLTYAIGLTGTYVFDIWLYAVSAANAAGDVKYGLTFPTGTCHFSAVGPDSNIAANTIEPGEWTAQLSAVSGTSTVPMGLSTATTATHLHGLLIATATGNLRLQWAQFGSNANASTVKAGSHMLVRQVA